MSLRGHCCDCNIHGLALLELGWDGAQAVGHLGNVDYSTLLDRMLGGVEELKDCWMPMVRVLL